MVVVRFLIFSAFIFAATWMTLDMAAKLGEIRGILRCTAEARP